MLKMICPVACSYQYCQTLPGLQQFLREVRSEYSFCVNAFLDFVPKEHEKQWGANISAPTVTDKPVLEHYPEAGAQFMLWTVPGAIRKEIELHLTSSKQSIELLCTPLKRIVNSKCISMVQTAFLCMMS